MDKIQFLFNFQSSSAFQKRIGNLSNVYSLTTTTSFKIYILRRNHPSIAVNYVDTSLPWD